MNDLFPISSSFSDFCQKKKKNPHFNLMKVCIILMKIIFRLYLDLGFMLFVLGLIAHLVPHLLSK